MGSKRYSIGEMARIAGVSVRALRLYEEAGLVVPARRVNGYRSYSEADARRLARVLAMKDCGLSLATIGTLLGGSSEEDLGTALSRHLESLQGQRLQLDDAIRHTQVAMARVERMREMSAEQAFEAMKREYVRDNEARYGVEARRRYGGDAVDGANASLMGMNRRAWDERERLEREVLDRLAKAMGGDDPDTDEARELVSLHRRWVGMHWGTEPALEAYLGLARGYLTDERFVKYYDSAAGKGATEFLVQSIEAALARGE